MNGSFNYNASCERIKALEKTQTKNYGVTRVMRICERVEYHLNIRPIFI